MADPIITNRPRAVAALRRKYAAGSPVSQFLGTTTPTTRRAVTALDAERANLGQSPLTATQTRLGATAADRQRAITPEPETGFLGDVSRNIRQIIGTIPHIPATLISEASKLPQAPAAIEQATRDAANPLEMLGNVAQAPGVRMLPGAFIASQFGTGGAGVQGIAEDPVFSLLDVLPFASKAARSTRTFKTAQELAQEAATATGTLPRTPRPLSTVARFARPGGPEIITRDLFNTQVRALQPNIYGAGVEGLSGALARSTPGKFVRRAFGTDARELARIANRQSGDIAETTADVALPQFADDASRTAAAIRDEGVRIGKEFSDIPEARRVKLSQLEQAGDPAIRSSYTPRELEYTTQLRVANERMGRMLADQGDLTRVDIGGSDELYTPREALRIQRARHLSDSQLAAANLRGVLDPASPAAATPTQLLDDLTRSLADDAIPAPQRRALTRAYLVALDRAGVDIAPALSAFSQAKNLRALQSLPATIDLASVAPRAASIVDDVVAALSPSSRNPVVRGFLTAVKRGDWDTAAKELVQIKGRKYAQTATVDFDQAIAELRSRREAVKATRTLEKEGFNQRRLSRAQSIRERAETTAVAPRFQEAVRTNLDEMARSELQRRYTGTDLDDALQLLDDRLYKDLGRRYLPEVPGETGLRSMQYSARRMWQDLKAKGYDPAFMHHTPPQSAVQASFPRVMDFTPSLTQTKARLWDSGPYIQDAAVALQQRGVEYLIQQGSKAFVDEVVSKWAKPLATLDDTYLKAAREAYEANPTITLEAHRRALIEKDWRPFNPRSFINGTKVPAGASPANQLMVPRVISENLAQLRPTPGELGKLIDPVMKVFRTSLLPLSPRWHLYNIVGGVIMTVGRARNPVTVMRYAKRAWRMTRDQGGVEGLARNLAAEGADAASIQAARLAQSGGRSREAIEWFRDVDLSTPQSKLDFLHQYAAGRTARRLWDSAPLATGRRGFNTFVEKSFKANQFFDDFYRAIAYLEGSDAALRKGLSRPEQIRAGIKSARDTLQNWDTLTPIERSTMRYIFPFYSWTRTLLRYTLTYPADHPWRTAILASIARAEIEDQNTGLPESLRSLLYPFDTDAEGNTTALSLAGVNPFRDVANYASLLGFISGGEGNIGAVTSQVNPILGSILQAAGVDPSRGEPELFPDLRWDPATGRLVASAPTNPAIGLIGNLVPQTRPLAALVGLNDEIRDMARRNPEAALRYLGSSVGIPILARTVNIPRETVLAETRRYDAMRQNVNSSLKSGDMAGLVAQYPGLSAFAKRIRALEGNEALTPQAGPGYVGGAAGPGVDDLVRAGGRLLIP